MTRDFNTYFLKTQRTYYYRLKTITPIGDFGSCDADKQDAMGRLDTIERVVARFEPVSFSPVKKTILQRLPLDFPNVENREVFILDMVLALPVSPTALRRAIKAALDIPEEFIALHGECDPQEIEMQVADALAEIAKEASDGNLVPAALLDDSKNSEGDVEPDDVYGNRYNRRFLSYLNAQRTDRADTPEDVDGTDFNKDIKGAPSAHPNEESPIHAAPSVVRRTFRDADGKLHTLTRTIDMFGDKDA